MWGRMGRGAVSVSFDNESLGDFNDVGHHVRDVTLWDVVLSENTRQGYGR